MLVNVIRYEEFELGDLCAYLEDKFYNPINSSLFLIKDYLTKSNLYEKDNDNAHGIVRVLTDRLADEIHKLFKNDTLILFPKIKNGAHYFPENTLKIFSKMHYSIINIIERIKPLMNYYIPEPYWNIHTHLLTLEFKQIEQNFETIVYIKENYLWPKIKLKDVVG